MTRFGHDALRPQPVDAVQRGDAVTLGERRIVEDAGDEVVDRAAESDDRLADVDELRREGQPPAKLVTWTS